MYEKVILNPSNRIQKTWEKDKKRKESY